MSSDGIQDLGIRLRADGVLEATNGVKLFGVGLDDLGGKADGAAGKTKRLGEGLDATGKQTQNAGKSAKELAAAYRLLPAQITDIVTSLASGQPVWLVAIQQGGQLKDIFGGIVPMFRALAGTITPTVAALGTLGGVVGISSLAMYQGWQESKRFADGLALTGNQAALTEGQFNQMVMTIAAARHVGAGDVRELLQVVTTSGIASAVALESTARAALALAKVNGKSAADNARSFEAQADGVSDWAVKAQRAYHYLSAEQYRQIMSLEAQGRTSEAVRVNMTALSDTLDQRTTRSLGAIERLVNATTRAWSNFWEAAKGIGRSRTVEEQLAELKERLELTKLASPGRDTRKLEALIEPLQREAARNALRAADQQAEQQARDEAVYKASRQYQDTLLAIESAGNTKLQAEQQLSLEQRRIATEQAYDRFTISAQAYRDKIWAIERERLANDEEAARREIAIESRRVVKSEAETNVRDAAVASAQAKLLQVRAERARLEADLAAGKYDPKPREPVESARAQFRRSELGNAGSVDQGLSERRLAALDESRQLVDTNRSLNADLIKDDRARGEAQIALEAEQLKRRMDLGALSVEERKRAEDAFSEYMVLRQKQLNEQLKPEWQRMLELWGDTTRAMRTRFDEFQTGWLQEGRQAWADYAKTGTLSLSSLWSFAKGKIGESMFEQFGAPMFAKLGEGVSSLFGITNPAQTTAIAAETSARTAATTATTLSTTALGGLTSAATQAAAALAAMASSSGGSALGSLFGSAGSFSTGLEGMSPDTLAYFWHGGGSAAGDQAAWTRTMPASNWARAPRFHGGIGPDELPAVIQRTEGVFTKGQMKALAPVADVAKAAGGTRITFSPQISIDSRTDRAEVLALVQGAMRTSQAQLLDMMERGQV